MSSSAIHALLRAFVRRDGLKRFGLALHEQPNPAQQLGVLQYAAEGSRFFVRIEETAGIRIIGAGRLGLEANAPVANSLFVSVPDGIQRLVVDQLLENDVAVIRPTTALLGFFLGQFAAL